MGFGFWAWAMLGVDPNNSFRAGGGHQGPWDRVTAGEGARHGCVSTMFLPS